MAFQKPITPDQGQATPADTWQRAGDVAARLVEQATRAAAECRGSE